ncbi:MAG: hypothetical protein WKF61_07605, partial [Luteimonas sp.]
PNPPPLFFLLGLAALLVGLARPSAVIAVPRDQSSVVLVLDGPVSIQGTIFGFVFIRSPGNTLNAVSGSASAGACPSNCMLTVNAGAAIYGAMVLQGQMKANGSSAVIFDATVLGNISKTLTPKFATLPGAWNDQASY